MFNDKNLYVYKFEFDLVCKIFQNLYENTRENDVVNVLKSTTIRIQEARHVN